MSCVHIEHKRTQMFCLWKVTLENLILSTKKSSKQLKHDGQTVVLSRRWVRSDSNQRRRLRVKKILREVKLLQGRLYWWVDSLSSWFQGYSVRIVLKNANDSIKIDEKLLSNVEGIKRMLWKVSGLKFIFFPNSKLRENLREESARNQPWILCPR